MAGDSYQVSVATAQDLKTTFGDFSTGSNIFNAPSKGGFSSFTTFEKMAVLGVVITAIIVFGRK